MAFSDFDLRIAIHAFALRGNRNTDLFFDVPPVEPGEFLRIWLEKLAPVALGVNSEKARSAFIITPILAEVRLRLGDAVSVLPGVTLEVDKARGLAGSCDYLIARAPNYYYLQEPILAVVEAKKEDLVAGLGQCVAEMVAIRLFNEQEGTPVPVAFGCVTSGNLWRFMKLDGPKLFIDCQEYYLHDVPKILGILVSIARG